MELPTFEIKLRENFSDNFGDPIVEIFKLIDTLSSNGSQYHYILDYNEAKFTKPLFTLALPLIIKMFERNGYSISILADFKKPSVRQYMDVLNFPEGVNPESIVDEKYDAFLSTIRIRHIYH